MEAIHKLRISCPYEILRIEDIKISCKPSEHGYLYLKCLVDDSINFKYAIEASTEDKIVLYEELEDKEKSIIFNGIIQNVITTNENGIYYLELEAATSSILLDIEEKTRSFQDAEMSYDDLINEILKDYKGYGFTQCMSRPMSIGKPLFQYKETDYEFLKRVASLLGLEVICDIINLNNMFYYGRPDGKKYTLKDVVNYKACKDLERYNKAQVFGIDFHDTDFFYYEVENLKKMDIGDKIYFKQKDLYVNQYEAKLHQGELIYKYRFCRERGIWQDKIYNQKIKGVSIEGKVLETAGEKLKIHLNIDESQDPSKAAWFYYAPPSGNILYSMPLVNESAMLYFQDIIEAAPIATNCVHKNGYACAEFSDTDNRYFATESGNYLDILPGAINFHRSGFNVNLNDESGITFNSSGNLSIGALGSVNLSAGSVAINATSKLLVQKSKSSYISLENEFYAEASVVYESGSARDSYGAFTDDEPTAGVAAALAKKKAELDKKNIDNILFNHGNLALSMCGSMAKEKTCIGPTTKDSVPLEGEALKNREDIPEFDSSHIYGKETIVKKKSLDGEYILGRAGLVQPGVKRTTFTPYDKESYSEHNSPTDAGKSIALGVADSAQELGWSTVKYVSYVPQVINEVTDKLSDGYKAITGVAPFGGSLECDSESWELGREGCDKISSAWHNSLASMAPHKKMFDSGNFLANYMMAVDGASGVVGIAKNIPKLINKGLKVAAFGKSALEAENVYNISKISEIEGATSINSMGKISGELEDISNTSKVGEVVSESKKISEGGKVFESDTNTISKTSGELEDISNISKDSEFIGETENISVIEVKPPGAKNPVQVYTDGYAQVNKGKIEIYIRGKIKKPSNYDELKDRSNELNKLKKKNLSEFTTEMEKELKVCDKIVHNYDRSQGMGKLLDDAGITDTTENNEMIAKTVLDSAKEVTPKNTKIRSTIDVGNKSVIVESWWIMDKGGTPYCSTIILIKVK